MVSLPSPVMFDLSWNNNLSSPSVQNLPHIKNPLNAAGLRAFTVGRLATLLCGWPGTVNVALVDKLSPNTGRAPTNSEIPGFHHAWERF